MKTRQPDIENSFNMIKGWLKEDGETISSLLEQFEDPGMKEDDPDTYYVLLLIKRGDLQI